MIELRGTEGWWTRRFRCAAVVGLTSASMLASGPQTARGAWFSLPRIGKTTDAAAPQSTSGFSGAIRKLTKEAQAQEKQGNLDQAIVLADRAAKLSEAASSVVKPSADVSPASTARYAKDLHLKKAELSVKRSRGSPSLTAAPATDRSQQESPPAVASDRLSRPQFAVASREELGKAVGRQVSGPNAAPPPKVRPIEPRPPQLSMRVPSAALPAAKSETVVSPAGQPRKSAPPAVLPVDPFWDEVSHTALVPPTTSATDTIADKALFVGGEPPTVTPMSSPLSSPLSSPSTACRFENPQVVAGSTRLKLRPRYDENDSTEVASLISASEIAAVFEGAPTITPMEITPNFREGEREPNQILPIAAERKPEPDTATSSMSEIGSDADVTPDDGERPWFDIPEDDFPTSKVLELQRRWDSAAALKPGEISRIVTADMREDSDVDLQYEETGVSPLPIIRLRKPRQPQSDLPSVAPVLAGDVRQPVIGRTSLIRWRAAKDESATPTARQSGGVKSDPLPDDLRQSLCESSAPLPPPDISVEQTAFHSPDNPSNRHRRSQPDRASPSAAARGASAALAHETLGLRRTSTAIAAQDDQSASTKAIVASGPIQLLAVWIGMPLSTASSILGAAGATMLVAGLWMVRAIVGVKK